MHLQGMSPLQSTIFMTPLTKEEETDIDEAIDLLVKYAQGLAKRQDLFDAGAACVRASYDALCRAGFTPPEALKIVSHQNNSFRSS